MQKSEGVPFLLSPFLGAGGLMGKDPGYGAYMFNAEEK